MFVVSHSLLAPKRHTSDCFFTFSGRSYYLRKVLLDRNGRAVLSSIVLYFFGLERHNCTKKGPPWSLLFRILFRLSKQEKRPSFSFVRLVKHSMTSDIVEMTHIKHMLSPSSLSSKIIGVLASNGGENGTMITVVSAVRRS